MHFYIILILIFYIKTKINIKYFQLILKLVNPIALLVKDLGNQEVIMINAMKYLETKIISFRF